MGDMSQQQDIYGGKDPRDIAAYTVAETARYLRIPPQTLRSWVAGQSYSKQSGRPPFQPLITAPEYGPPRLSFNNLVEAYTLRALRTKHAVSIEAARNAIDLAEEEYGIDCLLLRPELRAGAGELFLAKYGEYVNLNRSGQLVIAQLLKDHLDRIKLDRLHIPARLFPATHPTIIVIDPRIAFGRPCVARRGITTAAIVDRIDAGEDLDVIAEDYGLSTPEIHEAIAYEAA